MVTRVKLLYKSPGMVHGGKPRQLVRDVIDVSTGSVVQRPPVTTLVAVMVNLEKNSLVDFCQCLIQMCDTPNKCYLNIGCQKKDT